MIWLECQTGFNPSLKGSVNCEDLYSEANKLQCHHTPCVSTNILGKGRRQIETEDCEQEEVLLITGGADFEDRLTTSISVYPPDPTQQSCLPSLPIPLRWGALGLLGSTLLLCGGEDATEQPNSLCWSLDNRSSATAKWRVHSNMSR